MPVLDLCRNINTVTRLKLDCFLAFLLIISSSGYAHENLSATTLCMVYMPVVAAARLKCYVEYSNLACGYWCKIALSCKIPGKCIIRCTYRKYHLLSVSSHGLIFIRKISFSILPYFLGEIKYCPALRPACIECHMSDNCCYLLLGHTMCLGILQMKLK